MQGKKEYNEKLFISFQLSNHVPKENFYRRLREVLDLHFLHKLTESYYGNCGQKSIDPEVFMKFMLVGFLENIQSDRKLIAHCSMRLDILFFLGYDLDEALPWHSTLSRTRDLLPDEVFIQAFEHVLDMCIDKGMVLGRTQAIDAAPVKANASMDSLELKVPREELAEHLRRVRVFSAEDRKDNSEDEPKRKAGNNKAPEAQRNITADKRELQELKSRNKNWSKKQTGRPGASDPRSKYTSNKTHYSPVDPDARISVKPGKARKLNYSAQMAVDTAHHVITHIEADFADKKDNQSLQQITKVLQERLTKGGLIWRNVLADTGYSSGDNYAFLEQSGLLSFIPPHGTYKGGPEGFEYREDGDYWLCKNNKKVTFRKVKTERKNAIKKKVYFTRRSDCKGCPYRTECIGKSHERRIEITFYKEEYERAIARLASPLGRWMKKKRQSTVEPVFGTLTQFMALSRVNTRGIDKANKVMMMSAMAYNLKKYLKFTQKEVMNKAQEQRNAVVAIFSQIANLLMRFKPINFNCQLTPV
ncbi:MAG: IS1182 family transposase [Bacteroidetes bacterium]|nr:IS1182 family transposase [Bacteroidota bacterium]